MRFIVLLGLALACLAVARPALASTPAQICVRQVTDDTLRPVPEALAGAVNQLFGTSMPASMVAATAVYRCYDGKVQVCTTGANLPCGKANTSRAPNQGEVEWCRQNPAAEYIPAYITGHDTVFDWRCGNGVPQITRQVFDVDSRGFVAQFWKPLP
jgi:hypothetical protein